MDKDALIAHRRRMGMLPTEKMPETREDVGCCGDGKVVSRPTGRQSPKADTAKTTSEPVRLKERRRIRCSECDREVSVRIETSKDFRCSLCIRSEANGR